MTVTIKPENTESFPALYELFAESLGLAFLGHSLDALYDVLTEPREHFTIKIADSELEHRFNGKGKALLAVLKAAETYGSFTLI